MELILVRHGQPDWAPEGVARNDPALTELGARQARLLAEAAAGWEGPDALWVSPLRRARETAEPLAATFGLASQLMPWMSEIRNPDDWEGSPVEAINEVLAAGRLRTVSEMWDGLPGGETFRAFHERVVGGLERSLGGCGVERADDGLPHLWNVRDDDLVVVMVAHGGTNAVVLGVLLGLEPVPWEWERFASRHTAVARLATRRISHGQAFSLGAFGDVSHLPSELISA